MSNNIPKIRNKKFNEEWQWSQFGDIGQVSMCKRIFKNQTSSSGEIPFYKIGTFGGEADAYISSELFNNYKNKFSYPEKGNILLSASGTIGRVVEYNGEVAYFQDSNIVWLDHNDKIEDKFLKYFYKIAKWDGIEGSTINRLYNSNICNTLICYPSNTEEQKYIGNFLQNIDNLIDAESKKLQKLKDLKSAMLSKMFPKKGSKVPEIRFKGFSGEWEVKKIEEIAKIYDGVHQTPLYIDDGIKFVSVENINDLQSSSKYISKEYYLKNYKYNKPIKGDVLMTRIGDVGTPQIIDFDEEIAFYVSLALLRSINIDSYYLKYVLMSDYVKFEIFQHTLKTAIPMKINKNEIGLCEVIIPSLEEQRKIGSYFIKIDKLIEKQQQKLEKLINLKQAFLSKMFV